MKCFSFIVKSVTHSRTQQITGRNKIRDTDPPNVLAASDDYSAIMAQIQASHAPDGRKLDAKVILRIIEKILHLGDVHNSSPLAGFTNQGIGARLLNEMALDINFEDGDEVPTSTIVSRVSSEITFRCLGEEDAHTITMALFKTLSSYPWEAKPVVALAAISLIYGEFWMVAQLYQSKSLAKLVARLKTVSWKDKMLSESLKLRLHKLTNLIKVALDFTRSIVDINETPWQFNGPDSLQSLERVAAAVHIRAAVYWINRTLVDCASIFICLHEYTSTKEPNLDKKIGDIESCLNERLNFFNLHVFEKRHMEILKSFFSSNSGELLPLYDGYTKKEVSIDTMKGKTVLLLITEIDFIKEDIAILYQICTEERQNKLMAESRYEVVWVPMLDKSIKDLPWTEEMQVDFKATSLQSMPWLSLNNPSLLNPATAVGIRERFEFSKKPILVVLDQQGRLVNPNALHMIWIWRSYAFPFSSSREEELWKEESWWTALIAFEPLCIKWAAEGKYICFYGGVDLEWIRKFTTTTKAVARAADIHLEMLYVGGSRVNERMRKICASIVTENLSNVVSDLHFFWKRLECMFYSKIKQGSSIENDQIMMELLSILSYDGSDREGWAEISKGEAGDIAKGYHDIMLICMSEFDNWKHLVEEKGFVKALNEQIQDYHLRSQLVASRLVLPGTSS